MKERELTEAQLQGFVQYLKEEEKSPITIEKYLRDVRRFMKFTGGCAVTRELTVAYKQNLMSRGYAAASVNSMLASLNALLGYLRWNDCRVKSLRRQRQIYCAEEKELTREEYMRLLEAAGGESRLGLVMKTVCSTGIRISELKYFTVEAVQHGQVNIQCKNKIRVVLIPGKLRKLLVKYVKKEGIGTGPVFVTRNGKPLDRSNIWSQMKRLCEKAGVTPSKVFPHNLRKLFARTFYKMERDIAKLADILGHSSIDTTRIYIMSSGQEHRRKIERLGLVI